MKIPTKYNDADILLVVGTKGEKAGIDFMFEGFDAIPADAEAANDAIEILVSAMAHFCMEQISSNNTNSCIPLIRLAKHLAAEYPELVLDDETYCLRKSYMRISEVIEENKDVEIVTDAMMEWSTSKESYQFQISAISGDSKELWLDPEKTIFKTYDV
jgi:hypothetical protein